MQAQPKPVTIDTRQVALELLALAGRALLAGTVVSLAAAALIVGLVALAG
jgi:hypothetical protein